MVREGNFEIEEVLFFMWFYGMGVGWGEVVSE